MRVAGIDLSSKGCDIVLLELDSDDATWQHFDFGQGDLLDRVRRIRDSVNTRGWWRDSDVTAIGVERPAGHHGVWQVSMALGALLQTFPPDTLVTWFVPAEWRVACGLKGNAPKSDAVSFAVNHWPGIPQEAFPDGDACDAYAIAWATRQALEVVDSPAESTIAPGNRHPERTR